MKDKFFTLLSILLVLSFIALGVLWDVWKWHLFQEATNSDISYFKWHLISPSK